MKPEPVNVTTLDRPATQDEIRRATATVPARAVELFSGAGNRYEISSELGGRVRYSAEEFEFFVSLTELETVDSN